MTGFGGRAQRPPWRDFIDSPDFAELMQQRIASLKLAATFTTPQAIAEIQYNYIRADLSGHLSSNIVRGTLNGGRVDAT